MSRAVVIGATGHIGSYLVPRLVRGGHEVIAMSRGTRDPYHASPQWNSVSRVVAVPGSGPGSRGQVKPAGRMPHAGTGRTPLRPLPEPHPCLYRRAVTAQVIVLNGGSSSGKS